MLVCWTSNTSQTAPGQNSSRRWKAMGLVCWERWQSGQGTHLGMHAAGAAQQVARQAAAALVGRKARVQNRDRQPKVWRQVPHACDN